MEAGTSGNDMVAFVERILEHENDMLDMLVYHSSLSTRETDIRNRLLTRFYALWARFHPFLTALLGTN